MAKSRRHQSTSNRTRRILLEAWLLAGQKRQEAYNAVRATLRMVGKNLEGAVNILRSDFGTRIKQQSAHLSAKIDRRSEELGAKIEQQGLELSVLIEKQGTSSKRCSARRAGRSGP